MPMPSSPSSSAASSTLAVVIMGVAGSGKTTIGERLAQEIGWSFRDADEFHSSANIAKMAAGIPLNDDDRAPWLAAIRSHLEASIHRGQGAVVTCSALKARYRAQLMGGLLGVRLVHLQGSYETILERLKQREGHFMKPEMLRSQFEALEVPADALPLDIKASVPELVASIRRAFGL